MFDHESDSENVNGSFLDSSDEEVEFLPGKLVQDLIIPRTQNRLDYIESWSAETNSMNLPSSNVSDNNRQMLPMFEVVQTKIIDQAGQKKHVQYTIMMKNAPGVSSTFIDRRYTDFLNLYKVLNKEYPSLTNDISFPKKVILGNFEPGVISTRSTSFEKFLKCVVENVQLRESISLRTFLCGPEEKQARLYIQQKNFKEAHKLLENCFIIYNRLLTNRHPKVIISLCLLIACCNAEPSLLTKAHKYGELALNRFEGISDTDLLCYYVPLLQLCVHLWWKLGKEKQFLDSRLENLKRCGHRVDNCPTLLEAMLNTEI